ncbi:putative RNA-directed DNA polymerase [Tanacetum coccineum]
MDDAYRGSWIWRIGVFKSFVDIVRYMKEQIKVEYEWHPPTCHDCHVFGHTMESCPKRLVEVVKEKEKEQVQEDGFTIISNKNKKSKKKNNAIEKDPILNLKNPFETLSQQDDLVRASEAGECSGGNGDDRDRGDQLESLDMDSEVEEVYVEPMSKTSNASLCAKGCRIILGWDSVVVNVPIERHQLWADLGCHKLVVRGMPWVLMGDYNVALNLEDSHSGSSRLNSAMIEFKDCVSQIEVMDINCSGIHFTWNQKPRGEGGLLKKLDRIMGNLKFVDSFPAAYALFQPYKISDHSPTVLKIPTLSGRKQKPFKFFNFLTSKVSFPHVVAIEWNKQVAGHSMYQIVSKLKSLKKPLRKLLHDQGNLHDRVNKLRHELDEVQKALDLNPTDSVLREEEAVYVHAFNEAKLDEERFLKQKAKVEWLQVGDSNSAYFHKSVKSRNQRCRIEVIKDEQNVIFLGLAVPSAFVSHYEMFLGSAMACTNLNIEGLFTLKFSESSYLNMVRHVSDLEIKEAMFSIGDDRAPSPDGYTFVFFKKEWDIVGVDVCKAIRDFFVNGQILKEINHTFITLIPKLMHNYHRNRGPPRCAFKVDIQKAYDTVDWVFLGNILKCFSFHPIMIKWIMACVSSTSFSICINGDVHGFFKDDLFMFAQGDVESAGVIMESLDEFKLTLGLVPNIPISTAFFCNVLNHVKIAILNIIPFSERELPIKYLGVPLISLRLLNKDCKVLVKKAKNRIGDWKNKSLSFAGHLQLCKSVTLPCTSIGRRFLLFLKVLVFYIQNLIRGFLWCNGDYKCGKAKVAWVDICLPLSEGGLGLRSLEVFNKALLSTHIWNIVSNKESLWAQWIHTYKLKRRSLWDIPIKADATSIWFDYWCDHCPLSRFLSPREISNAGYTCSKVLDLMVHNAWNWPSSWLIKALELGLVPTPSIQMYTSDVLQWRDSNEAILEFSVKNVWEAIRPRSEEVDWYRMVWFPYCVPRHAFFLWLVMRNSLKTQDRLKQWDVGINTDLNLLRCSLCDLQADSREHLFFECSYSTQVWATVRRLASMDNVPPVLQNILLYLQPMAHKRTAKSIIGKILLVAAIYFIWIERNNHLFKDIKKNPEELCDMIMITVRLKLITLRFKNTNSVNSMLERWKLPTSAPPDCVAISMPKCLSGLHLLMYSASYVWLTDTAALKFFKANWDVS